MKNFALGFTLLGMVSCSTNQILEIDGLERVKLSQESYEKPQFFVKRYKPTKQARTIASVDDSNRLNDLPAKNIYFFSLLQEYRAFKSLIGNGESLKACPQFHHEMVTQNSYNPENKNFYKLDTNFETVKLDPKNLVHFPVLSLPYKGVDLYSYMENKGQWESAYTHTVQAIKEHNQKNFEELQTLCDKGVSPGYYIYENMISYYTNNEDFQKSYDALPSILKVNTVSNMLILDSMVKPQYKSEHLVGYKSALLEQLKVGWFKNYLYETNLMRNNNKKRFVLKD